MSKELFVENVKTTVINAIMKARRTYENEYASHKKGADNLKADKALKEAALKGLKESDPNYKLAMEDLISANRAIDQEINTWKIRAKEINDEKKDALNKLVNDEIYSFGYLPTIKPVIDGFMVLSDKKRVELPKDKNLDFYLKEALTDLGFGRVWVKNPEPFRSFLDIMHSVQISKKNSELFKAMNATAYKELFAVAVVDYLLKYGDGLFSWNKNMTGLNKKKVEKEEA